MEGGGSICHSELCTLGVALTWQRRCGSLAARGRLEEWRHPIRGFDSPATLARTNGFDHRWAEGKQLFEVRVEYIGLFQRRVDLLTDLNAHPGSS